jgi:hypothetical protein
MTALGSACLRTQECYDSFPELIRGLENCYLTSSAMYYPGNRRHSNANRHRASPSLGDDVSCQHIVMLEAVCTPEILGVQRCSSGCQQFVFCHQCTCIA